MNWVRLETFALLGFWSFDAQRVWAARHFTRLVVNSTWDLDRKMVMWLMSSLVNILTCPVHHFFFKFQVATMICFLIYHSYLVELTPPRGLGCHDLALIHMALYQTSIKCQECLGGGDAQALQGASHLDSYETTSFLCETTSLLYEITSFLCDWRKIWYYELQTRHLQKSLAKFYNPRMAASSWVDRLSVLAYHGKDIT